MSAAAEPFAAPSATQAAGEQDLPRISVVAAVRNEADFIEPCLRSVLANDYPPDRFEVIVVDGRSTDGTRAIVERLAAEDPRVKLLDNPRGIVACGVNLGIAAGTGEIITWIGGHAELAPDFLRQAAATLRRHPECWCVGGRIETVSEGWVGRSIAAAMSSPVGVGNAMFRLGGYEGYVDTVAFASYRKWIFEKIGLFDEELVRNQDDEFNARIINAGGRIYMNPAIRTRYYARSRLGKLARQYYQYGFWRIRTIQKLGRPATLRQVAPLVFVLIWLLLIAGTLAWRPVGWALAGFAGAYLLGLLAGALDVARKSGWREALLAPLVFMILHFGYGLGSLKGLIWFVLLRRGPAGRPEGHPLSR